MSSEYPTAIEILDDENYVLADNDYNIASLRYNVEAESEDDRKELEYTGCYHLGYTVNKFQHGALVSQDAIDGDPIPTVLFGTIRGAIGVLASLKKEDYDLLEKLQSRLANKIIFGVGGLKHDEWRTYAKGMDRKDAKQFLDGDLIETFLELGRDKMEEAVRGLGVTVDEMIRKLDSIVRRIH